MAISVSDLSFKLFADAKQFVTGFASAQKSLADFGKTANPVVQQLNNLGKTVSGLNALASLSSASGFLGPLANSVQAFAGGNAMAGTAAAIQFSNSILEMAKSAIFSVAALKKQADQLGISRDAVTGFSLLIRRAGQDLEELQPDLTKGMLALQDVRQSIIEGQSTPATQALRRLNIDLEAFARMDGAGMFFTFGDALKRASNEAQRLYEAAQVFGRRQAGALMPIALRGTEQFNAARRDAFIRPSDIQAAADFKKALTEISAIQNEITQRLGVEVGRAFLPALTEIADFVKNNGRQTAEWFNNLAKVLALVGTSAQGIGRTVAALRTFSSLEGIGGLFGDLSPETRGRLQTADAFMGVANPASAAGFIMRQLGELNSLISGPQIREGSARVPLGEEEIRVQRDTRASEMLGAWRDTAAQIGMSTREVEIYKQSLLGVNPVIISQLMEQDRITSQLERQSQQASQIRQQYEQSDAVLQFQLRMQENRNNSGLTSGQRDFANAQAFLTLERSLPRINANVANPAALMRGSAEASSAILASRAQQSETRRDPIERVREVLERAREVQQSQLEELRTLNSALRASGEVAEG